MREAHNAVVFRVALEPETSGQVDDFVAAAGRRGAACPRVVRTGKLVRLECGRASRGSDVGRHARGQPGVNLHWLDSFPLAVWANGASCPFACCGFTVH